MAPGRWDRLIARGTSLSEIKSAPRRGTVCLTVGRQRRPSRFKSVPCRGASTPERRIIAIIGASPIVHAAPVSDRRGFFASKGQFERADFTFSLLHARKSSNSFYFLLYSTCDTNLCLWYSIFERNGVTKLIRKSLAGDIDEILMLILFL